MFSSKYCKKGKAKENQYLSRNNKWSPLCKNKLYAYFYASVSINLYQKRFPWFRILETFFLWSVHRGFTLRAIVLYENTDNLGPFYQNCGSGLGLPDPVRIRGTWSASGSVPKWHGSATLFSRTISLFSLYLRRAPVGTSKKDAEVGTHGWLWYWAI